MDRYLLKGQDTKSQSKITNADDEDSGPPSKIKKKIVRKYDDAYLKLGFYFIGMVADPKPQCVVCFEVLANESFKPSKLSRHLQTKHPECLNKPVEYFLRKKDQMIKGKQILSESTKISEKALKASYLTSLRIAKCKKPHTIAENLLLPAAIDMCTVMLGPLQAEKLKKIPLSNNSVSRRIADMAEDIELQLIERIKLGGKFALQLDESTDVSNSAILLVYVRYIFVNEMESDILFSAEMPTRTTGEEIFRILNDFLMLHSLSWANCVGITTDGAAAMTGKHTGVIRRVKNVAPNAVWYHCFIHREALVAKNLSAEFNDVLENVVKIVNFIKASALNSRYFEILCTEMGSEHVNLLLHSHVRWLSRGKVLQRVYELRQELHNFFEGKKDSLSELMVNNYWLSKLAYLSDIFGQLNDLNISLQGKMCNIFLTFDKLLAFQKKLKLWIKRTAEGRFDMFPQLSEYIEDNVGLDFKETYTLIQTHLVNLLTLFESYFPTNPCEGKAWMRDPFNVDIEGAGLNSEMETELLELSCDGSLKIKFSGMSLAAFWLLAVKEYKKISDETITFLLPFTTTYLCETAFSAMVAIKTKYRNKLHVGNDLRVSLSTIAPNIDRLVSEKQAQVSH